MGEMLPNLPALGILFDAGKIESGGYGMESWKIFWQAIDERELYAKILLFEGDLMESDNVYCIGLQTFDKAVLDRIRKKIEASGEYNKVSASPRFIEGYQVVREPLPNAGMIEPNGNFVPRGYNSKAAFDSVRKR